MLISFLKSSHFHSGLQSIKAITENQLHDFLINSRHSHEKYCFQDRTLSGITIIVDPRKNLGSGWEIVASKNCPFHKFSSVIMNFFSLIQLISFIDPFHHKNSKSLMLEVA